MACSKAVHAITISEMYAEDRNATAGLLYTSTASSAESRALSKYGRRFFPILFFAISTLFVTLKLACGGVQTRYDQNASIRR